MMVLSNGIARRVRVDLGTPAETAIRQAVDAVESMSADTRLTEAVVLLQQARDKVSDYVDDELQRALKAHHTGTLMAKV